MMASCVHRASHSSMLWGRREEVRGGDSHPPAGPTPAPPQPLGNSCLWDVRTTALPSLMTLMMVFHSMRRAWGSMPVVGSSCGGQRGQGPGLLHPPQLASSGHYLWQAMHKVTPQWSETPGTQAQSMEGRWQSRRVKADHAHLWTHVISDMG